MKKKLIITLLIAIIAVTTVFAADSFSVMNAGPARRSSFHIDANIGLEGMFLNTRTTTYTGWVKYTSSRTIAVDLLYRAGLDFIYNIDPQSSVFAGGFIKYYCKPSGAKPDYAGGRIGLGYDFSEDQAFVSEGGAYIYGGYYTGLNILDAGIGIKATIGARPVGSFKVAANLFAEYPVIFSSFNEKTTLFFPSIFYAGASLVLGF